MVSLSDKVEELGKLSRGMKIAAVRCHRFTVCCVKGNDDNITCSVMASSFTEWKISCVSCRNFFLKKIGRALCVWLEDVAQKGLLVVFW
jgi:hypothetical protein